MEISRVLSTDIEKRIGENKVLLLYGSRRVGKTSILRSLHQSARYDSLLLNGEDLKVQKLLEDRSVNNYAALIGSKRLLMIDEAQTVPEIGKVLKLMIDEFPKLTILASGSSSFDLSNQAGNPLVGRSYTFQLYPIAQMELAKVENALQTRENLEERLIYGSYPEVVTLSGQNRKADYLIELVNGYLLKDILVYDSIKNSSKLLQLLQLIAYQVGSEVSYEELGKQLGLSRNTVEKYLDLLSMVFVLYKLPAFSNNHRKEITKPCKWYFSDNGLRNALIGNFSPLALRTDTGALWENYMLVERMKFNAYSKQSRNYYFWRTYDGQEVDFIEKDQRTGQLAAFECKWNPSARNKIPGYFKSNYPEIKIETLNPDNYLTWCT
jgi:predicted AAA+ superfamily ATPase